MSRRAFKFLPLCCVLGTKSDRFRVFSTGKIHDSALFLSQQNVREFVVLFMLNPLYKRVFIPGLYNYIETAFKSLSDGFDKLIQGFAT